MSLLHESLEFTASVPGPVLQLQRPLADEDADDEDDQPPQQAHTLLHQLRGEADK